MSILSAVPAAISAGANVLGAVLNHQDSKADRSMAMSQFNSQMDESIQRKVADGLKAGINPLAAIGASTNVSPTIHAGGGSDTGGFISRAGEHLARLFESKQEDDIEYDNQAKELDLESKRLENRILRQKLSENQHNISQGSGTEVPNIQPSRHGERALFVPAYDLKGRPRLVANQDVIEGDNDNAGYRAAILTAIANGDIDKTTGKVKNPQTRLMLDDMYHDMTGHHIKNLEELYISPTEMGLVTKDEARDIWQVLHHWFGNKDRGY